MRFDAQFMDSAVEDYDAIIDYLSQFYPSTPTKFLNELHKKVEQIKNSPQSCPVYQPIPEYRRANVLRYGMFYKVFEDREMIEIHRIIHSAMNIPEIL